MTKIKITGTKEVTKNLNKIKDEAIKYANNESLEDLGDKIGNLASDKVPVDRGILKSTFTVQKAGKNTVAGYNTEYAMYQHQGVRKDGTHIIRNRPGGGESFFLVNAVKENTKKLLDFYKSRFEFYFDKIIK
jgi:hypothetical protein